METGRKVLILGIDGIDPGILEGMMGQGELPNFTALAERGCFSPLETTMPPQSPVAWTTIATGCSPAQHGIYDFLTKSPGEYVPKLAILKQGILGYERPFAAQPFWEIASARGLRSTILKWPLTFPANPLDGLMLTGLGTPDLRGTMGKYSFFTTRPIPEPEKKKGEIVPVEVTDGKITTNLPGPMKISLQGKSTATVPLEIELSENAINCHLPSDAFFLREGEWSDWIRISFKVGLVRSATALCRFYLESVKPEFNLYVTPPNIDNTSKSLLISYPPGYAKRLADAVGTYSTLGLAEDANALNDELIGERGFLSSCDLLMKERERLFFYELENFDQEILACVFDTTDRIKHMFWRYWDGTHPRHDAAAVHYADVIPDVYRRMDGILGKALDKLGPDTLLVVCSDHGFTSFSRQVHLNTWLVQNGFMALNEGRKDGRPLFADVDWAKTSAFAFGLNSLFLNLKNREKAGSLDAPEAELVKRELVDKLAQLRDGDKKVISRVDEPTKLFGTETRGQGPDFIVGFADGYRVSWQTALGEAKAGKVIEDNTQKWSGDHCCAPEFVPGIFLSNFKGLVSKPHIQDICPMILDYLA